jgi:hypothetical protein
LKKMLQCLRNLRPDIRLDEDLRRRALKPLGRMLDLSTQETAGSSIMNAKDVIKDSASRN